jgi:hypothetical protein
VENGSAIFPLLFFSAHTQFYIFFYTFFFCHYVCVHCNCYIVLTQKKKIKFFICVDKLYWQWYRAFDSSSVKLVSHCIDSNKKIHIQAERKPMANIRTKMIFINFCYFCCYYYCVIYIICFFIYSFFLQKFIWIWNENCIS